MLAMGWDRFPVPWEGVFGWIEQYFLGLDLSECVFQWREVEVFLLARAVVLRVNQVERKCWLFWLRWPQVSLEVCKRLALLSCFWGTAKILHGTTLVGPQTDLG